MSLTVFVQNIIEYLEKHPEEFGRFAEWVILDANGPEKAETLTPENRMNAVMQIEQAMTTTRKTAEAICMLFPPETWQGPNPMPITIAHLFDDDEDN